MSSKIKIFEDHIMKRIETLDNEINLNCLKLYNEYKVLLDEAYLEGIVEYEIAQMEYNIKLEELNSPLWEELNSLEETCKPVKVLDLHDIYFAQGVH